MDFKQVIGAFILIVLAIYVANMWTAKELDRQQEAKDYRKWLEEQALLPAPTA